VWARAPEVHNLTKLFRVGPTSASPLNLAAYAATRAGVAAHRLIGKYGFNTLRRLTRDTLASQTLRATSHGDILLFPAVDDYSCAMFLQDPYEPEIYGLLALLRGERYSFVDCGANLGYWAVQVSGASLGGHRCVAIEASSSTFQLLERNSTANQDRFPCLHAAVHRTSGDLLLFDNSPCHEARHLVNDGSRGSAVISVSIDDVVARFLPDSTTVIVKLDIEGAEPEALAGASRTRSSRDCLFIIEDHGADKQHRSAAACFAEGLRLWFLDASAKATPIPDLAAVARVKTGTLLGYNFLACEEHSPLALRLGLTPEAICANEMVHLRSVTPPITDGR
jgi:FkbM family methyltransferase